MAKESLTDLSDADLLNRLDEKKEDLFQMRFQYVTGQLDNNQLMGVTRKDIARVKTEIRRREIAAAEAGDE